MVFLKGNINETKKQVAIIKNFAGVKNPKDLRFILSEMKVKTKKKVILTDIESFFRKKYSVKKLDTTNIWNIKIGEIS